MVAELPHGQILHIYHISTSCFSLSTVSLYTSLVRLLAESLALANTPLLIISQCLRLKLQRKSREVQMTLYKWKRCEYFLLRTHVAESFVHNTTTPAEILPKQIHNMLFYNLLPNLTFSALDSCHLRPLSNTVTLPHSSLEGSAP